MIHKANALALDYLAGQGPQMRLWCRFGTPASEALLMRLWCRPGTPASKGAPDEAGVPPKVPGDKASPMDGTPKKGREA